MGGAAYARGSLAWGLCQRCGLRFLLNDLLFDGYMPGLRVCDECYDDRHPQEFPISVSDPQALWKPAPDGVKFVAPVLSFALALPNVRLNWTSADFGAYQSAGYSLYRDTGLGFVLLATLANTGDFLGTKSIETKTYLDTTAPASSTVSYRVDGYDVVEDVVPSNVVAVST